MEGQALLKFLSKHKGLLGGATGIAAGIGGAYAAKPAIENLAADLTMKHYKREGQKAIDDTIDFADKHPYVAAAALSGVGLGTGLGSTLGNRAMDWITEDDKPKRRR